MELKKPTSERSILYVPNERGEARQWGYRRALASLEQAGLVNGVTIYSLHLRRELTDGHQANAGLLEAATRLRPDLLLIQHPSRTGLTLAQMRVLRSLATQMVYHEADPYSRFVHPLPSEARAAARFSDVTFTVGSGSFTRNLERAGARDVRWIPHVYDPGSWSMQPLALTRELDVVMIANRSTARLPGRRLPGARSRDQFVTLATQAFGDRFRVYGKGWEGPSAAGPIPYPEQGKVLQNAWISANWDHYPREPHYFSDRLPISLALGSIHATTEHDGYQAFFRDCPAVLFRRQPEQLIEDMQAWLKRHDAEARVNLAMAGSKWAEEHLRQDFQLVQILRAVGWRLPEMEVQRALNSEAQPSLEI